MLTHSSTRHLLSPRLRDDAEGLALSVAAAENVRATWPSAAAPSSSRRPRESSGASVPASEGAAIGDASSGSGASVDAGASAGCTRGEPLASAGGDAPACRSGFLLIGSPGTRAEGGSAAATAGEAASPIMCG